MKAKLNRIIQQLILLRDQEHDDEISDEIENALIHLDAASDRLIQMEEEDEDDEAPSYRLPDFDLP
jgi:IMP cyclohydrolase